MDQATTCIPLEPQPSSRRRLYFRMDNHFTNEILKTPVDSTTRMNDLLYCRASISVELAGEYLENAVNAMRSLSQGDPNYVTAAESLQLITEAINANSKIRAITYRHRHLELSAEKEEQDFDPSTLVLCSRVKEEDLSWTRMLWKIMQLTLHSSFCVLCFLWSLGEFSRVLMLLFACILLLRSPFYSLGLRILKYIL
ncbi:hypothetical protein GGU10DRAFT_359744 [Lentinula aff. detonsa]|uniref:Uncharacterized protein n=2 Tax=Lentinula TaxID=5352 RepID=A0AA38KDP6_9AGAR|nr:hypothetical protein GGU10DRAFT_359744 [Lentinula aff. detonsa]KAJ3981369.1 hypothetical protein F5890DRAFT_550869 [Lentinula detonsa]